MAKPMIVLIKRFTYRGNQEEWSNAYHFNESPPSGATAWKTLIDALAAQEKTVYGSDVKIVRAYGYADSNNDADVLVDYTALAAEIPGTMTTGSLPAAPGDCAGWIRWSTTKKSSKGKSVYLRKYYHGVIIGSGSLNNDTIYSGQRTAYTTFGGHLKDGTITGFTLCGADGTLGQTVGISNYATTRTLKRRGKRPPT